MYSAIKINGKKLYEYARAGKNIEVAPRKIQIYNIYLNSIDNLNNEIIFTVECSKGTYIRSLCQDIAKTLNTIGTMKDLKRLKVGQFSINESITIEELEKNKDNIDFINKHFITFEEILKEMPKIFIKENELNLFLNGVQLQKKLQDGIYKVYNKNNQFIGTAQIKNNLLKRDIVL